MKRRGFFGTIAAALGVAAVAKPEPPELRFETKTMFVDEGAAVIKDCIVLHSDGIVMFDSDGIYWEFDKASMRWVPVANTL